MEILKEFFKEATETKDVFYQGFIIRQLLKSKTIDEICDYLDIDRDEALEMLFFFLKRSSDGKVESEIMQRMKNLMADVKALRNKVYHQNLDKKRKELKSVIGERVIDYKGKLYVKLDSRVLQDLYNKREHLKKRTRELVEELWSLNQEKMFSVY